MSENNKNNNNEDEGSKDPKISIQQLMQQRQQMSKQNSYAVTGDNGEKRSLFKDYTEKATIYFKKNTNSHYHIDRECTKVLIESCSNCKIVFNSRVKTEVVEIWKCENLEIIVNRAVIKTLQIDLCKNVSLTFKDRSQMQEVIWAGVDKFTLAVGADELKSGLDDVLDSEEYKAYDINPDTDQFIIRYVDGKLLQELIVRLENGFPTTDREADAFAERKKRNDEKYLNFIRSLLTKKDVAQDLAELENLNQEKEEAGQEAKGANESGSELPN